MTDTSTAPPTWTTRLDSSVKQPTTAEPQWKTRARAIATRAKDTFEAHPKSKGETYLQHLRGTGITGVTMIAYGAGALVNAVFPFWFQNNDKALCTRLGLALDAVSST